MNPLYMASKADYRNSPVPFSSVPDLISSYDDITTDPSPSPPMDEQMFSILDAQYQPYLASPAFPEYTNIQQSSTPSNLIDSIDFTDLTGMHKQDSSQRRRLSTTAQDKEAATNMRIRRRAQNRASQRAFRERKDNHVNQLEQELEFLEKKHTSLEKSYSESEGARAKLEHECDELREQLTRLRGGGSSAWASMENSPVPTHQAPRSYKGMDQGPPSAMIFDPFADNEFFT